MNKNIQLAGSSFKKALSRIFTGKAAKVALSATFIAGVLSFSYFPLMAMVMIVAPLAAAAVYSTGVIAKEGFRSFGGMKPMERTVSDGPSVEKERKDIIEKAKSGPNTKDELVEALIGHLKKNNIRVSKDWDNAKRLMMTFDDKYKALKDNPDSVRGFVYQGNIFINPDNVDASVPIHEYTHIWAEALRQNDAQKWKVIVEMLKQETTLWEGIKQSYPHLETDDEIADEVLATYSGNHGFKKLQGYCTDGQKPADVFHHLFMALEVFWKSVTRLFDCEFSTLDDVCNRIMYDLLKGNNPIRYIDPNKITLSDRTPLANTKSILNNKKPNSITIMKRWNEDKKVNLFNELKEFVKEYIPSGEDTQVFIRVETPVAENEAGRHAHEVTGTVNPPKTVDSMGILLKPESKGNEVLYSHKHVIRDANGLNPAPYTTILGRSFDTLSEGELSGLVKSLHKLQEEKDIQPIRIIETYDEEISDEELLTVDIGGKLSEKLRDIAERVGVEGYSAEGHAIFNDFDDAINFAYKCPVYIRKGLAFDDRTATSDWQTRKNEQKLISWIEDLKTENPKVVQLMSDTDGRYKLDRPVSFGDYEKYSHFTIDSDEDGKHLTFHGEEGSKSSRQLSPEKNDKVFIEMHVTIKQAVYLSKKNKVVGDIFKEEDIRAAIKREPWIIKYSLNSSNANALSPQQREKIADDFLTKCNSGKNAFSSFELSEVLAFVKKEYAKNIIYDRAVDSGAKSFTPEQRGGLERYLQSYKSPFFDLESTEVRQSFLDALWKDVQPRLEEEHIPEFWQESVKDELADLANGVERSNGLKL